MSDRPSLTELLDVRRHLALPSTALVEKDWYVTRAIAALAALDAAPFRLVFAGGTCLARAYKLVRRMSEDVDFKVVPIDAAPIGRSVLRRQLASLREKVTTAVATAGFAVDPAKVKSLNENHYIVYQLPYEPTGSGGEGILRPTLQIELTYAYLRQPSVALPVRSFVAEAFGRPTEVTMIDCVSLAQTAAEKFIALTRRTAAELADVSRDADPMLVRHLYDLHALRDHVDLVATAALAHSIAIEDAKAFKNQYPAYLGDIVGETHKAIDAIRSDEAFRQRYERFIDAMVYGDRASFDAVVTTIAELARQMGIGE